MLLARSSLPPQFLLPAWSSHQLEQAIRRIHTSTSPAEEDTNLTRTPVKEADSRPRIRRRRTQKGYLHRDLENQTLHNHIYLGNPEASPSSQVLSRSASHVSQDETQQAHFSVEEHEQKLSAHQRWVKNKASRLYEEKDVTKRLEVLHATISSPKRRRVIRQYLRKLERIETAGLEPEQQREEPPNNASKISQVNTPRAVLDALQHELPGAQSWTRDKTLELLEERDDSKRLETLQAIKSSNRNSILVLLGKLERGTEAIVPSNPQLGKLSESQLGMRNQARLLLKQYAQAKKLKNLPNREAYDPGSNTTWTQSITKGVNWFLGRSSEDKHESQKVESRLPEEEASQMRYKMEGSEKQNKATTVSRKQQSPKAEMVEDIELSDGETERSLSIGRAVLQNRKANQEAGETNSAQSTGPTSTTNYLKAQNMHSPKNPREKLPEVSSVVQDEETGESSLDTTRPRIQRWVLRNPQDEAVVRNSFTSEVSVWRPEKPHVEKISDMEAAKRFFEWQSQQGETISSSPLSHQHKATPQANKVASNTASQTKQAIRPQVEQPLSLFEELFPEERKARSKRERTNEEILFNLPAFNWTPPDEIGLSPDQMVKAGKRAWKALSRGEIPKKFEISEPDSNQIVDYTPFSKEEPRVEQAPNMSKEFEPSVLILHACSKNLEESDFFRLGPKGNHIEGWTSGIKRVIPGRDNQSLLPMNHYYILFNTSASASAYLSQVIRLHKLAKSSKYTSSPFSPAWSPRLAPPPGYEDENSIDETIKKFTLAPGHTRLSIRKIEKPYPLGLSRIVHGKDPLSAMKEKTTSPDLVLFHTDSFDITEWDIFQALSLDGKKRNMHWKIVGKKDAIKRVVGSVREERERESLLAGEYKSKTDLSPKRFTIAFEDRHEARRFVREWHRRAFPSMKRNPSPGEPVVVVNAEILW